jgi:hypothetical protein
MSITFKIIKDGQEISRNDVIDLLGYQPYSLDGIYTEKSDYFVMEVCFMAAKKGLIDRYEMEGDPEPLPEPEFPDDPDIIY